LFQPFQSTKHGGLGIGLSLSRTLVEHWQGELHVASPVGQTTRGTQVRIALPLLSD